MLSLLNPSVGRLLISEPFLADPNFKRSVVLLSDYGEGGAMGFILNQPSDLLVKDLIPDLAEANFPIYIGGPVEVDTIHFIHCCHGKMNSGELIADGIYWGGDFETLKILVNTGQIEEHEVKFFLGYAGWGFKQLEEELATNTWIVSDQYHQDTVFSNNEEELWKEVIINLGAKYAHLSNFPIDPSLN
jgi:putative transcriptional regulator